jgi:phosphate transport system protein
MSQLAQKMLRDSLDAFVQQDAALARAVIASDDRVDALNRQVFRELLTFMLEDPRTIPRAIRLVLVARDLERIADHATNIAEMVVFLAEGRNIRHSGQSTPASAG